MVWCVMRFAFLFLFLFRTLMTMICLSLLANFSWTGQRRRSVHVPVWSCVLSHSMFDLVVHSLRFNNDPEMKRKWSTRNFEFDEYHPPMLDSDVDLDFYTRLQIIMTNHKFSWHQRECTLSESLSSECTYDDSVFSFSSWHELLIGFFFPDKLLLILHSYQELELLSFLFNIFVILFIYVSPVVLLQCRLVEHEKISEISGNVRITFFILGFVVVSLRWVSPHDPDVGIRKTGERLEVIRTYLRTRFEVLFVWCDFGCLSQQVKDIDGRVLETLSGEDTEYFKKTLTHINLLFPAHQGAHLAWHGVPHHVLMPLRNLSCVPQISRQLLVARGIRRRRLRETARNLFQASREGWSGHRGHPEKNAHAAMGQDPRRELQEDAGGWHQGHQPLWQASAAGLAQLNCQTQWKFGRRWSALRARRRRSSAELQSTEGTMSHSLCPSLAYVQRNVHREIGSTGGVERGATPSTNYLPPTPRSIGALHQRGPLSPELQNRLGSESLPAAEYTLELQPCRLRPPLARRIRLSRNSDAWSRHFSQWTSPTAIGPILHRIAPRHTCASAQDAPWICKRCRTRIFSNNKSALQFIHVLLAGRMRRRRNSDTWSRHFSQWTSPTAFGPTLHRIASRHTCASAQDATWIRKRCRTRIFFNKKSSTYTPHQWRRRTCTLSSAWRSAGDSQWSSPAFASSHKPWDPGWFSTRSRVEPDTPTSYHLRSPTRGAVSFARRWCHYLRTVPSGSSFNIECYIIHAVTNIAQMRDLLASSMRDATGLRNIGRDPSLSRKRREVAPAPQSIGERTSWRHRLPPVYALSGVPTNRACQHNKVLFLFECDPGWVHEGFVQVTGCFSD